MMRAAILLAVALGGCAVTKPVPAVGGCDAEGVQGFVGRVFGAAVSGELQRLSGARTVRVVRPGEMVTMDFRSDRLTVTLDAAGKIVGVNCG